MSKQEIKYQKDLIRMALLQMKLAQLARLRSQTN